MDEMNSRQLLAVFIILILTLLGAGILVISSQPPVVALTINPPLPTATAPATMTPAPLLVYVTGAVQSPQSLLRMDLGSRVQDAIDAAGGALPDADLSRVNLAALLRDGDQIHIFTEGEAIVEILPTASGGEILDINRANETELIDLPGVGPALAARIVAHREEFGLFSSLEDLDAVPGIGPGLLSQIEALIRFE